MNKEEAEYYLQSSGFSEEQIDTIEKAFTSTDAISRQAVQDYIAKYLSQYLYNDVREAVEVIDEYIGELPSVNPQPCEDAISRTEVIKSIDEREDVNGKVDAESVRTDIVLMQPVNPQPKAGHWEQYGNSWEDKFKCSECGKEQPKILCGERIIGHWSDYCPNCGCRMVEPQESEDKNESAISY